MDSQYWATALAGLVLPFNSIKWIPGVAGAPGAMLTAPFNSIKWILVPRFTGAGILRFKVFQFH